MTTSIEELKAGWYGLTLGLKKSEVDQLVENLLLLRDRPETHFHARSRFFKTDGIADIEFRLVPEDMQADMDFDFSEPVMPTR